MKVLPVLDLLNGIVVRGVAGLRAEYRPVKSRLTTSIQPLDMARALRTEFGFNRFYVADLDAILHQRPNWPIYRELLGDGFTLLIDAGIDSVEQSVAVRRCGAQPIIGLESCPDPRTLAAMVAANDGDLTFSLDLQDGRPLLPKLSQLLGLSHAWNSDPRKIVRQIVSTGVRRLIVLDLADVGTAGGGRTERLCRSLLDEFPRLELTCGGGVRGTDDLRRLKSMGAAQVLVASALHDGRMTAADLCGLSTE